MKGRWWLEEGKIVGTRKPWLASRYRPLCVWVDLEMWSRTRAIASKVKYVTVAI